MEKMREHTDRKTGRDDDVRQNGITRSGNTGESINKGRGKGTRTRLTGGITCDRPVVWLVRKRVMMREQNEKNQAEGTINGRTGAGCTSENRQGDAAW